MHLEKQTAAFLAAVFFLCISFFFVSLQNGFFPIQTIDKFLASSNV